MAQIFPKRINKITKIVALAVPLVLFFIVFVFWYWFSPWHLEVGYSPRQPVAYSHKLHAGKLGIDCRYCHTGVERSNVAGVPPSQTCMNCHKTIKSDSAKLTKVINSFKNDVPIEWVKIHKLPDYVYFDHSAHVLNGVGCVSCHGRVDKMQQVRLEKPLSMAWCFECHRSPEKHLVPLGHITDMKYQQSDNWLNVARDKAKTLRPPVESCSGCHR